MLQVANTVLGRMLEVAACGEALQGSGGGCSRVGTECRPARTMARWLGHRPVTPSETSRPGYPCPLCRISSADAKLSASEASSAFPLSAEASDGRPITPVRACTPIPVVSSADRRARYLGALRIVSTAVAAIVLVEYGLGIGVNLYTQVPGADENHGFGTALGKALTSQPAALAVHVGLGLALLLGGLAVLARAVLARHFIAIAASTVAFLALIGAAGFGASFVDKGRAGASMTMADDHLAKAHQGPARTPKQTGSATVSRSAREITCERDDRTLKRAAAVHRHRQLPVNLLHRRCEMRAAEGPSPSLSRWSSISATGGQAASISSVPVECTGMTCGVRSSLRRR